MYIERISVVLIVTITVLNTVHCTPTWNTVTIAPRPKSSISTLPASSEHVALSEELLDVLKKYHPSLPGTGSQTPVTGTTSMSPPLVSDRISIMHFPAVPGSINADQSSQLSSNPVATPNPIVPDLLHQRPTDLQMSERGYNQMVEPPLSHALLQSKGPAGNPLPVSILPTISDSQSSPTLVPPASSHSPDPALLKEPISVSLPSKFNQELTNLLTDLRMTPVTLQEPGKNQILAPGQTTHSTETLQLLSSGSSTSLQPSKIPRPILGLNQTPLDYLLSSSSPMQQFNYTNRQPSPTVKPRPNLEFVKYLLTLPRYQQALNELIAAQSSIQT
ncbi:uncharacterized protein LOC112604328 [Melanaphis sacchari]|uniref:uncharacterized protein LOC112604328 n=1 Tax=Melanaphis sacchari TaxID=742174 RepID=UPI000DC14A34|nr:uncharacterized protein LOC112604328 [Melanaphis sacchari]